MAYKNDKLWINFTCNNFVLYFASDVNVNFDESDLNYLTQSLLKWFTSKCIPYPYMIASVSSDCQ